MTQPSLISVHPNECIEGLHYYPFAVNLDKYRGICNTLNDLSTKVCVPNKTEDLNLITGTNESKIFKKTNTMRI